MTVRYLLDTHVWLWWNSAPQRLSEAARRVIASGETEILFSAASGWELAIKHALGKLTLPASPARYVPRRIASNGLNVLPVTLSHSLGVADLPHHHRDPFDRLLTVQAMMEGLTLITADRVFRAYGISLLET